MFDVMLVFLEQLTDLIVPLIGIYVIFDYTGSLIFGKR